MRLSISGADSTSFVLADVDSSRIAYVGHSYGAQWGAILSGIGRRFKTFILMAGVPSDSSIFLEGSDPTYIDWRKGAPPEVMARYFAVTGAVAVIRYVPYASPKPLFFQFARYERIFGVPAMERYYAAAREPKTVKWYGTGHELNDPQALIDRANWVQRWIGIDPIKAPYQMPK